MIIEQGDPVEAWNLLLREGIATEDELTLLCRLHGFCWDNLMDVLYYRTGCIDIIDYMGEATHD